MHVRMPVTTWRSLAASRKAPLEIRRYAIRLAGEVGYCDVIPTLERMLARLESSRQRTASDGIRSPRRRGRR